ncbi:transglycosylase family protein [Brevibacterium sp. NPDC049920]|uniref:Resuscitation-promoting factor core lysozyme-like domain-containing protein n=1 Tax=Brevibacterium pityocampae TaxID=506594 RepID=A0ABP8JBX8_9MICO
MRITDLARRTAVAVAALAMTAQLGIASASAAGLGSTDTGPSAEATTAPPSAPEDAPDEGAQPEEAPDEGAGSDDTADESAPEDPASEAPAGDALSSGTGAFAVRGAIASTWHDLGGAAGDLGRPTTAERCGLRGSGCYQRFQKGEVHWSPKTGAHATLGAIANTWARTGHEGGKLGYPTSNERCGLKGGGCYQRFQKGEVHWSPKTGARATTGAIARAWSWNGHETGDLGYPTSGERCGLKGGGCYQKFQKGQIHWSPKTGAHATKGGMQRQWAKAGWENGSWGYPTGSERKVGSGRWEQRFQGGLKTYTTIDPVWDRLAQCESGGNWKINTGNGYYGGLQFSASTWKAFGGHKYAKNAHLATREQQIEIAQKVQKVQGWGAWPACTRKLGIR